MAKDACCVEPEEGCNGGDCLVLTKACEVVVNNIGGNVDAPATPEGFVSPGVVATYGDRPFAGSVMLSGTTDCMTGVDYYEFVWSQDGVTWNDMPFASAGAFQRSWLDISDPLNLVRGDPVFSATPPHDGRYVFPTLQFYESMNPAPWGTFRLSVDGRDRLMNWLTDALVWTDGLYRLRVRG